GGRGAPRGHARGPLRPGRSCPHRPPAALAARPRRGRAPPLRERAPRPQHDRGPPEARPPADRRSPRGTSASAGGPAVRDGPGTGRLAPAAERRSGRGGACGGHPRRLLPPPGGPDRPHRADGPERPQPHGLPARPDLPLLATAAPDEYRPALTGTTASSCG